ncbi:MAG TPA: hypothetical protein VFW80_04350 [Gaiellaceae bacterium]|nr:hypothetical protein [Gaiellaceae bacterium]
MYLSRTSERRNQDVFRRANERLLDAVRGRVDGRRRIPFLCECLDPSCRSTVALTIDQFEALRDEVNRFAIVTGHPRVEGEHVITTHGDVTIVEKSD